MFEKVELNNRVTLYKGDNAFVLPQLEDNSIDAIITDPPAGIAFMGKDWDKNKGGRDAWIAWMEEVATQCLRIIKPGGHALVWAIPRTSHWTATAWENAGWEVRDKVYHAFASGFPSKAIDRHLGAEREVVGINEDRARRQPNGLYTNGRQTYMLSVNKFAGNHNVTAAATPQSQQWEGWNTTLKPAIEEWIMFRKPTEGTIVENVLQYGVGGINIDDCRVPTQEYLGRPKGQSVNAYNMSQYPEPALGEITSEPEARYPTNLIHDGSDEVVEMFPVNAGGGKATRGASLRIYGGGKGFTSATGEAVGYGDSGSAARFFYCAKASRIDRDEGLEEFDKKVIKITSGHGRGEINTNKQNGTGIIDNFPRHNTHPTVKPTALVRYFCRLITPPDGIILDLFMGSGSTGKAAMLERFRFIGIEKEHEYFEIAQARILWAYNKEKQGRLF